MSAEGNKTIARRFYNELINVGEVSRGEDLVVPDFVDHPGVQGLPPGREGLLQFIALARTAFPDLHVAIEDLMGEGDRVAVRVTVSGTQRGVFMGTIPPTGKRVTWTGQLGAVTRRGSTT